MAHFRRYEAADVRQNALVRGIGLSAPNGSGFEGISDPMGKGRGAIFISWLIRPFRRAWMCGIDRARRDFENEHSLFALRLGFAKCHVRDTRVASALSPLALLSDGVVLGGTWRLHGSNLD